MEWCSIHNPSVFYGWCFLFNCLATHVIIWLGFRWKTNRVTSTNHKPFVNYIGWHLSKFVLLLYNFFNKFWSKSTKHNLNTVSLEKLIIFPKILTLLHIVFFHKTSTFFIIGDNNLNYMLNPIGLKLMLDGENTLLQESKPVWVARIS